MISSLEQRNVFSSLQLPDISHYVSNRLKSVRRLYRSTRVALALALTLSGCAEDSSRSYGDDCIPGTAFVLYDAAGNYLRFSDSSPDLRTADFNDKTTDIRVCRTDDDGTREVVLYRDIGFEGEKSAFRSANKLQNLKESVVGPEQASSAFVGLVTP